MQGDAATSGWSAPGDSPPLGEHAIEQARIEALHRFGIWDIHEDRAFDDLTALAARLCGVPMAVVSLVDADRIWFKWRRGVPVLEVRREGSLFAGAMGQPGVMTVDDARADPRFADDELVVGELGVRFFAGATLTTAGGIPVGALCVMDTAPRVLRETQLDDLALLARQVASQLELRLQAQALTSHIAGKAAAEAELSRSRHLLDEVLAHTDVLVYAKDLQGRFLLANTAVERTIGQGLGVMIGRTGAEVFPPTAAESFRENDSQIAEAGSWDVFQEELEFPDGSVHRYRSTKFPLFDADGEVYAVAGVSTDITELAAVRAEMAESVGRFRALFDLSPVGIALSDENGLWFEANPAFSRLLGVDPSEMVGRSALDFAHPDDHALIAGSELGQLASPDGVMRAEMRFVNSDGSVRCALVNVTPLPGPNGEHWTLGIAQDITERKEAETALRRSEEELAAITAVARCVQSGTDPRSVVVASVRSVTDAVMVQLLEPSDAQTLFVSAEEGVDPGIVFETGRTADLVRRTGRPVVLRPGADMAGPDRAPAEGWWAACALWQPVVVEGDVIAVLKVIWSRLPQGMTDRALQSVAVLAGEAGASLHAAQLRTELERSAATDPLTGALNRRAWDAHLQSVMEQARATTAPLTIAFVDLDNFKAFNDGFGHGAGDDLLMEFAALVRGQLRSADLFARWGGEEFVLALPDCDSASAAPVLERVRSSVPDGQTCSIGHTIWRPGEPVTRCFARADEALYLAKGTGRNRVVAG